MKFILDKINILLYFFNHKKVLILINKENIAVATNTALIRACKF